MPVSVGIGYDSHRFGEDRPLILGGVEVPFERGLVGHSDADVLTHAVADARGGWLMPQESFKPSELAVRLESLFGSPATLQMAAGAASAGGRADAATGLADMVSNLLPSGGGSATGGNKA